MLSTERFTEIDSCSSFVVTETQKPSVLFCPSALNGNVNIHPICNNPLCKKKKKNKSIAPAGAILATCPACPRKLLLKKTVVDTKIDINQYGKVTAVTVFPPEITNVFVEETL